MDAILDSIDFGEWAELREKIEPILLKMAEDGISVAFDQIGFDAPKDILDQVNEKAVEFAKTRSADMVGMTFDEDGKLIPNPDPDMAITDGTRELLRGTVTQAIEDGTSTADLTDQLEDEYAFGSVRAERIARFEIAQADVEGNLMAYRDSGVVEGKEVILGSEHGEPDECDEAADMGVVGLDDDFGGNGDPPFHPGCVCDVLPVLAGDEDS